MNIEQYKEYHTNKNVYPGNSFGNGYIHITDLIRDTKSKTLLDYGCGKALQYFDKKLHRPWGTGIPTLYDPAVTSYNRLPKENFDGIFSTDVMEHIPEEYIPSVFNYIFSHAQKFVFLGISTRLANTILPNGQNAHCTVKPIQWWSEMVCRYNKKNVYTHLKCYGKSNGYMIFNAKDFSVHKVRIYQNRRTFS